MVLKDENKLNVQQKVTVKQITCCKLSISPQLLTVWGSKFPLLEQHLPVHLQQHFFFHGIAWVFLQSRMWSRCPLKSGQQKWCCGISKNKARWLPPCSEHPRPDCKEAARLWGRGRPHVCLLLLPTESACSRDVTWGGRAFRWLWLPGLQVLCVENQEIMEKIKPPCCALWISEPQKWSLWNTCHWMKLRGICTVLITGF